MTNNTQLPAEVLRYKAGAAEYYMQHNYRELYGLLQTIFQLAENAAKATRTWYTEKEMYNYLRLKGYSHEIAEELSKDWVISFQGAYHKGLQHATQEAGATEYATKLYEAEQEIAQLKQWKTESAELLNPILDYGQSKEANIPLGQSITDVVLERCKKFDDARALLQRAIDSRSLHNVKDYELLNEIKTFLDGAK